VRSRLKRREADVDNCGIDVAMKSSSVCVLDGRGAVLLKQVVSTDEAGLASVLKGRRRPEDRREGGKRQIYDEPRKGLRINQIASQS